MPISQYNLNFDSARIRFFDQEGHDLEITWNDIVRIAYVSENTGLAITDDYFLAIQSARYLVLFSMSLPESIALSEACERKYGCKLGTSGKLYNSTKDESVVFWPAEETGLDLIAALGTRISRFQVIRITKDQGWDQVPGYGEAGS